jgi:hypothetical protein
LPALWLLLALVLPCGAQSFPSQQQLPAIQPRLGDRIDSPAGDFGPANSIDEQKRLRLLNIERQKSLVSDADKLLKLARQFNAEMLAAHPASLTPDQVRTLSEMEKLARSVKAKMSVPMSLTPLSKESPPFP